MEKCQHKSGQILWENERYSIFECHYGCGEVLAYLKDKDMPGYILDIFPTTIKPYVTDRPELGLAYYWQHEGLWHSTPPIEQLPIYQLKQQYLSLDTTRSAYEQRAAMEYGDTAQAYHNLADNITDQMAALRQQIEAAEAKLERGVQVR
jgi:hypothetical protein